MSSVTARLSLGGDVFGIAQTAVKPPAAAARGAGADVFLVLVAGLAQVAVEIDEPGHDPLAADVDHLDVAPRAGRRALSDPGDRAVLDEHVGLRINTARRIDDSAASEQEIHVRREPLIGVRGSRVKESPPAPPGTGEAARTSAACGRNRGSWR